MENNLSGSGSQSSSVSELEKRLFDRTKKAKRVKFFRNGDKFFSGITLPVLEDKYRTFDSLIADVTKSLVGNVTLPNGVRTIYNLEGKKMNKVEDFKDGQSYVCSGAGESFKRMDYEAISLTPLSFKLGPESRCNQTPQSNGTPTFGNGLLLVGRDCPARSKLVTFIRNGTKPRKVCRLLMNKRNSPTLEQALEAITHCVKLDTGCVRKVYTQNGTPVTTLQQFFNDDDVFFAYGNERVNQEDFELDFEESKTVLQFNKKAAITRVTRKNLKPSMPVKASRAANGSDAGDSEITLDESLMPEALRLKYNVAGKIGEGNFAVVQLCVDKENKQKYALKIIDKRKSKGKEHYISAEVRVMKQLCHPHIVTLYEEFQTPDWLFLVLELVHGGDLFDRIAYSGLRFTEPQIRLLIGHLTSAIAYLHSLSIVHRDIKPENLLVDEAPDGSIRGLKLADFGLAVEVTAPLKVICGTPTYVAPEILLQNGYGLKIDVWAAGVILYVLLCGFPPFSSREGDQDKLFDAILSGRLEFPLPFWQNVSAGAIDLVSNMLRPQPELRFAAEDVLDHIWMSDDYDSREDHKWFDED